MNVKCATNSCRPSQSCTVKASSSARTLNCTSRAKRTGNPLGVAESVAQLCQILSDPPRQLDGPSRGLSLNNNFAPAPDGLQWISPPPRLSWKWASLTWAPILVLIPPLAGAGGGPSGDRHRNSTSRCVRARVSAGHRQRVLAGDLLPSDALRKAPGAGSLCATGIISSFGRSASRCLIASCPLPIPPSSRLFSESHHDPAQLCLLSGAVWLLAPSPCSH